MATTFKKGDTAKDLTGTLKLNGVEPDLTNATGICNVLRPNLSVISHPATLGPFGHFAMAWAAGDLDYAGDYWAEVEVTFQDGTKKTFGRAMFNVEDTIA